MLGETDNIFGVQNIYVLERQTKLKTSFLYIKQQKSILAYCDFLFCRSSISITSTFSDWDGFAWVKRFSFYFVLNIITDVPHFPLFYPPPPSPHPGLHHTVISVQGLCIYVFSANPFIFFHPGLPIPLPIAFSG